MNNQMNNRKKSAAPLIWIGLFVGALVFAAALLTGLLYVYDTHTSNKATLENMYEQAFMELSDEVNNIEINLSKLMISAPGERGIKLASDIGKQSEGAVCAISRLPIESDSAAKTIKFFNQLTDFCEAYARAAVSRETFDESALEKFYATARKLNSALDVMREKLDGTYRIVDNMGKDKLLRDFISIASNEGATNSVDYPELIYDGPFSDGKLPACFRALEDLEEITDKQAVEKISLLFGSSDARLIGTASHPDAFIILGSTYGKEIYACVSRNGGMMLNLSINKRVGNVTLNQRDAELAAVDFAGKLGYKGLVPVWYNFGSGEGIVNLAPEKDGVIYYTDLVKVKVAMDDGTVLGLEATGYCRNHCERACKAVISENTARSLVSGKLNVFSVRQCVVPDGESEKLCFEVAGRYEGLEYFVYVNAVDGSIVNIMRVVDGQQGQLTV